jgi:hypothetical protein
MARFRNHRGRWLVALLGLGLTPTAFAQYVPPQGCTWSGGTNSTVVCSDEGQAYAAAKQREGQLNSSPGIGVCPVTTPPFSFFETRTTKPFSNAFEVGYRCGRPTEPASTTNPITWNQWQQYTAAQAPRIFQYTTVNSCATRPEGTWEWFGGLDFSACKDGCEYASVTPSWSSAPSCAWQNDVFGNRQYRCQGAARTTGTVCAGTTEVVSGDPPPDPDRDGDGTPNENDDAPDDPGCSANCGPDDPGPEDPGPEDPGPEDPEQPEDPGDGQDDGQQVSETLGPKLDAIEQAVLGLGPKVDAVKAAVDAGTAAANSNAAAIVGAINAQGTGGGTGGEGSGTVDLTPLTPGDGGGEHPGFSEIVEEGSVADMLGQLDQDGFGLARSCPAYTWQMSFDLGWTDFSMGPAVEFICTALQVFAYMIALAGFIQAAYILGRVGAS